MSDHYCDCPVCEDALRRLAALEGENTRLRAALERIACEYPGHQASYAIARDALDAGRGDA